MPCSLLPSSAKLNIEQLTSAMDDLDKSFS
jgi:hypothetical protein